MSNKEEKVRIDEFLSNTLQSTPQVLLSGDITRAVLAPSASAQISTGWTFCTQEGGFCALSGTKEVRYGINGEYYYKTLSGGTPCTNAVFGDPIRGVLKQCHYRSVTTLIPTSSKTPTPTPSPSPSNSWIYCARENQNCVFSGTKEVRYGMNGSYFYKILSNGAMCNNTTFGDPIRGITKECHYRFTTATPAPTSTLTSTPTPSPTPYWTIKSISSMKETKDKICGQDDQNFINSWISKAMELGVNYIAVETPYDSPACGDSVAYTKAWANTIHNKGLGVWHRHMPLAFEGIYNAAKNNSTNYLSLISNYIKANPSIFRAGDIFTPIPEPQNGGISGVSTCSQGVCMFADKTAFNKWLRDAITVSESAFQSIGLGGKIKIGYYGFDGFVAWGHNNPDWNGILEDATVKAMGNITIDHYPELVGTSMAADLDELQKRYPGIPIIIGEWGATVSSDPVSQVKSSMTAAKRPGVTGFNYWHMGMGGHEALIESDFSSQVHFDAVKALFK